MLYLLLFKHVGINSYLEIMISRQQCTSTWRSNMFINISFFKLRQGPSCLQAYTRDVLNYSTLRIATQVRAFLASKRTRDVLN